MTSRNGRLGYVLGLVAIAIASAPSRAGSLLEGVVHDAVARRSQGTSVVWLSRSNARSSRELVQLNEAGALVRAWPVPRGAVAADVCAGHGPVFADARGLVDASGKRLLEAPSLLSFADEEALYFTALCGTTSDSEQELRVLTTRGIAVSRAGAEVTLPFAPAARLFGGPAHEGALDQRPYALALSLYVPRLYDSDVDGDGRSDLIAAHEGRVAVFLRGEDGVLRETNVLSPEVEKALRGAAGAEVRVLPADTDRDGASELVVSRREEAVATTTRLMVIDELARAGKRSPLVWGEEGHVTLLGTVQYEGHDGLVLASFDTSIVSLGSSLLSGRLPLRVVLLEGVSPRRAHTLELSAEVDVRAGRMAGAMPVITVDFDGDGHQDLLHLGERGKAAIHLRRGGRFVDEPSLVLPAPVFQRVIPLPAHHSVLLLATAGTGSTRLSFVRLPQRADEGVHPRAATSDAHR